MSRWSSPVLVKLGSTRLSKGSPQSPKLTYEASTIHYNGVCKPASYIVYGPS